MNVKLKSLGLAVATVLGSQSFYADATIISLQLSSESTAMADSVTSANSDTNAYGVSSPSSVYENTSYSTNNARADEFGWFYLTSQGRGQQFESSSQITQSYTVENDEGDQFFDFSFNVMNGGLNIDCPDSGYGYGYGYGYGAGCGMYDIMTADYQAEILLNGAPLWSSSASLTRQSDGSPMFAATGTMLGSYYASSNYYSWGAHDYVLNLGQLLSGQSLQLDYIVKTHTVGYSSTSTSLYGYAQFGDPNGFDGTANASFSSYVAAVPEPASLGFFSLALTGLAFASRRKKH